MDTGLSKGFGFIRMADNEVVPKILDHKHHMIGDFNVSETYSYCVCRMSTHTHTQADLGNIYDQLEEDIR